MALRANARLAQFKLDTLWDRPTHPEGWYFRSDHVPYARAGMPALMFSTNLHPDYHTPRDEPIAIDIPKLDEDDAVDVCHRLDRRDSAAAAGPDSRVQARTVRSRSDSTISKYKQSGPGSR